LAACGNPFPKKIRGKEDLGTIKGGEATVRGDLIFISGILARLSWFFYLRPARAL
jgi:hypothetical protein